MIDRLVALLLLIGCAAFATILFVEIERPDRAVIAASPDPRAEYADRQPVLRPLPIAPAAPPIAAILARPLFSPSRRPPQSTPGKADDTSGLADSRLAGIVIEPGRRLAIFAPQSGKLLTVTEGETVSGWRIETISPREVSLSGPEGTKSLQPKFDPNLAPPAEAQPPAVPAPVAAPGPVFGAPPRIRTAPGVAVPRPGAPLFIPGQARLRQLRRQ